MADSPAGTVPQAWMTVLRLAFAAEPGRAILAVFELVRGRRLRAWNQFCLAAASHPRYYDAWIEKVEPTLLPAPRAVNAGQIAAVLLGGDSAATRASLDAAFGAELAIFDGQTFLPKMNPAAWLLPIQAGDRVAPELGAVLSTRLLGCDAPLLYWDEDRYDADRRTNPWIKPGWDSLLFGANDGLVGSCVLRADLLPVTQVDNWSRLAFDIANDAVAPLHLPLVLTHRHRPRVVPAHSPRSVPPVSISVIIPTRDHADLLETCLGGLSRTHFPGQREIIIVDNDSHEPRTMELFRQIEAAGTARVVPRPGAFNFASLANVGVEAATGEMICLLNNDIEVIAPDWLDRMVAMAVQEDTGAVGARLLYPDGIIQHAGVALGIGGAAGHVNKGVNPIPGEFAPWHDESRTVSAVTAACLLVDRGKFIAVGAMNADCFAIDFNDVDLCLRLAARGWRNLYCAQATLIHHESRSRGRARHGADRVRFERELAALRARWGTEEALDPFHSPLFRRQSEPCLLTF